MYAGKTLICIKKKNLVEEMVQLVKVLAIKPDDLSLSPQDPYGEKRKPIPVSPLTSMTMAWHMCIHTRSHTHTNKNSHKSKNKNKHNRNSNNLQQNKANPLILDSLAFRY